MNAAHLSEIIALWAAVLLFLVYATLKFGVFCIGYLYEKIWCRRNTVFSWQTAMMLWCEELLCAECRSEVRKYLIEHLGSLWEKPHGLKWPMRMPTVMIRWPMPLDGRNIPDISRSFLMSQWNTFSVK
jgi:hypothetical protein